MKTLFGENKSIAFCIVPCRMIVALCAVAFLLAMFPAAAQSGEPDNGDITSGLVGWWKMDEESGTEVFDYSPTANHGTNDHITTVTQDGKIKNSFSAYETSYDTVASSTPYNDLKELTIAYWARADAIRSYNAIFSGFGTSITSPWQENNLRITLENWSSQRGEWRTTSGSVYTLGQWQHFAITYSYNDAVGTDPKLYINGVEQTLNQVQTPSFTYQAATDSEIEIGDSTITSSSDHAFDGRIDDFRIYSRVLSADDVALLYQSYPGDEEVCDSDHEAVLWYNQQERVLQYCNGSDWVSVGQQGCPAGVSSCGGNPNERVVFLVEIVGVATNVGGVSGADSTCNTEASDANLKGTYLAWIADSDPDNAPAVRFEQSMVPYVLPNGSILADDWDDLIDGNLDDNIDIYADGSQKTSGSAFVGTNVGTDGTQISATEHCDDFTSPVGNYTRGDYRFSDANWTDRGSIGCNNGISLFCFEQVADGALEGCTSPSGDGGEINYNLTEGVLQYCNGESWINIGLKEAEASDTTDEDLSPAVPTSGLVGHWALDDTNTTATATVGTDGSMQGGLDGASSGVSGSVNSVIDTGLSLDGVDDYIDTGSDMFYSDALTVCSWVNRTETSTMGIIATKRNSSGATNGLPEWSFWVDDDGSLYWAAWDTFQSSTLVFSSSSTLTSGVWTHVCAVQQGSGQTGYIYVNGVEDGSGTQTANMADTASHIQFGVRTNDDDDRYLNGELDDIRIYDRALDAEEIEQLYKSNSLVGHWALDDTTATTATDSSNSGEDGILSGTDFDTSTASGQHGSALNFDGADDFITIPNSFADDYLGSDQFTLSAWIYPNGENSDADNFDSQFIIRLGYNFSAVLFWTEADRSNPSTIGFSLNDGTQTIIYGDDDASPEGQWVHALTSYDGTRMRLYINGQQVSSSASSPSITSPTEGNSIGVSFASDHRAFNGIIDDARIYNRALSDEEIAQLYASTGGGDLLTTGCSSIGDTCDDGTLYAGVSPDGDVPMYTTPADLSSSLEWNDGTTNYTTTGATSYNTGFYNTNIIIQNDSNSSTIGTQQHNAAQACADLDTLGHADWYLPARNELALLYANKAVLGNNFSGSSYVYYWSSSEGDQDAAIGQRFSDGYSQGQEKYRTAPVRCVRKGNSELVGNCSSPAGAPGEIIYNDDYNIMQYCNGSEWIAMASEPGSATVMLGTTPPTGCSSPGDTCSDGSFLAGTTVDTAVNLYSTSASQSSGTEWKTSSGIDDINPDSDDNGQENTDNLGSDISNFPAFELCNNLILHGRDDWYLPAKSELQKLFSSGIIPSPNATHWSSTESGTTSASVRNNVSGTFSSSKATITVDVRCVRRDP